MISTQARYPRARIQWRPLAALCFVSVLGSTLLSSEGKAQVFAAPQVLHEALQPVALTNGFVSIRDRMDRARAVAARRGVAPAEVQRRWRGSLERKINRVEARIERQSLSYACVGTCSTGADRALQRAIERVRAASDPIREAQRLVHHQIVYRNDRAGDDHWQTPRETLARGAGDCEDHALLKRELLLEAGIDPSSISLVFLRTANNVGHVIVRVDTESGPRILDNRTTAQRINRLLPGDEVLAEYGGREGIDFAAR